MSFHPQDSSPAPSSSRAIDQNISVLTETKIKSFSTNHKETSRDDVQSFVIVNDIDVEEELSKAQKEGHRNFFKMLSMSFYGKVKSHSLDTQETRENQKHNMSPQTVGLKPSFARKASAHTPPESKREGLTGFKQKTQGVLKKTAPLIKDLPLTPEQFRRHILSPKDASIKMYSPVVVGKNCPGTMTSKDETKKEVAGFFREIQQRPQTCKKTSSSRRVDSAKKSGSSESKTPVSKDDTPSKANVFKLSRYPQKTSEQTEERVQLTNVEPSGLDIKVDRMWRIDKDRDLTPDNFLKEIKMLRKQGPRRENSKPGQEKSASTNNSGRSLPSSGSSQLKTGLKDAAEVKRFVLDQDYKPNTASGYAKSGKGQETKSRKGTKQKASSQESKNSSEDKFKRLVMMDLQDSSDNEDKRYRRQNMTAEGKNRQCSLRVDRQKSPIPTKIQERIPIALAGGIGSWGKAMLIPSTDVTPKGGLLEGKEKKSNSASQSKEPRKTGKGKADSTEKLSKMELLWPGKAVDWLDQERNAYTPKYDMLRQKGKEKTWNLFEMYGKPKEKKGKERPSSPGIEESHKHFDLLELLSQKRPEKI